MKSIILVLVVFVACSFAANSVSFLVSEEPKLNTNPYWRKGATVCYALDGMPMRELQLFKGLTYTFVVTASHPFYISTSPVGNGNNYYNTGVTGQNAKLGSVLTFTPDKSAPALLYYQAANARYMGWKINIIDPMVHTRFNITVAKKTVDNGFFQVGAGNGFWVDGVEAQELVLVRHVKYTFDCSKVPAAKNNTHRFYLTESTEGRGLYPWDSGVINNGANALAPLLTFTPGDDAPSPPEVLYYNCMDRSNMGWKIHIVDAICQSGKYMSSTGLSQCLDCPSGTYSTGASGCLLCPPGSYSLNYGSSSCTPCPLGQFTPGGYVACQPCRVGTYSNVTGTGNCRPCPPGTYTNQTGTTACAECRPGTRTCGASTECKPCPPGQFSASPQSFTCRSCPAGTFSAREGATVCDICPAGTYSTNGFSSCNPCPLGTSSAVNATNSFAACVPS